MTRFDPALTPREHRRDLPLERRLADGEQVIGAKVSLGYAAIEPRKDALEPRIAWLTDGMLLASGAVDISGLTRPRVEPKLAFRLARPLRKSVRTADGLLAATELVLPCLDILDSRFDDDSRRLADDVAENGATAYLLVGDGAPPPPDGHLLRVRVQLRVDGPYPEPEAEPPVRGCIRVPALEAVSWLDARLAERSLAGGWGTLLVSQAIGTAVDLAPGVRLIAHFSGLGTVRLGAIVGS